VVLKDWQQQESELFRVVAAARYLKILPLMVYQLSNDQPHSANLYLSLAYQVQMVCPEEAFLQILVSQHWKAA
jgi:hypothetical protein